MNENEKNYSISSYSSALAGLFLKEAFDKGETIEIPSLNIKISKNKKMDKLENNQ